jgi:hypothetical protein
MVGWQYEVCSQLVLSLKISVIYNVFLHVVHYVLIVVVILMNMQHITFMYVYVIIHGIACY